MRWDSLKILFLLHNSAAFVLNHYYLRTTSELCKHAWQKKARVIEVKFVLTLSYCSYKLARVQTLWQFHQKLGEFNYGWPTLQMNLVFRALNQNGADRVEVVIVTASERARPCFGHLKGGKHRHKTIIHTEKEPTNDIKYRDRERWRKGGWKERKHD